MKAYLLFLLGIVPKPATVKVAKITYVCQCKGPDSVHVVDLYLPYSSGSKPDLQDIMAVETDIKRQSYVGTVVVEYDIPWNVDAPVSTYRTI